jgi:hypothetical protein
MHKVWAVARNTIAQAVRMKVAVVVIMLLLVILPVMSFIMVGDGTLIGKLQTFSSYSMSLVGILLCVLTISISAFTLTNDLKLKQIFLVVTKPVCRFQIVVGKIIGVVILDAVLLFVFSSIIFGLLLYMPRLSGAPPQEIATADREFFTARIGLTEEIDREVIEKAALKRYQELEKSGELPSDMNQARILKELQGQELLRRRVVESGAKKVWEFENVRPAKGTEVFFVRYKLRVTGGDDYMQVKGTWFMGDQRRQEQLGPGVWDSQVYRIDTSDVVDMFREFEVSVDAIAEDGHLAVMFNNLFVNDATVIPEDMEVLYKAGSFGANFAKVSLMVFARLIFLTVLGVSLSTWLSFPVTILVCFVIFFIGTVNGFVIDSFGYIETKGIMMLYNLTFKPLLWLFPRFDGEFNPTRFMISARLLTWGFLGQVYGAMVVAKSTILLMIGIWIFSNREIARTIV